MDNFYKQCPPMMSDGRLFTDHRTNVRMNEYIKYINDINRDDDYRIFLQDNAENILDNQWEHERKNKSCWANECIHNYPTRMYPGFFKRERKAADSMFNPQRTEKYPCRKFSDYRATVTRRD